MRHSRGGVLLNSLVDSAFPFDLRFCVYSSVNGRSGSLTKSTTDLWVSVLEVEKRPLNDLVGLGWVRYSRATMSTQSLNRIVYFAGAAFLIVALTGCYLPILNGPPGTIGMQRSRAVLFDPYPSETLGPPIVGGRPRGFDLPLADVTNAQSNPNARSPYGY